VTVSTRVGRLVAFVTVVCAAVACGPSNARAPGIRQWTNDMVFNITTDPSPPRAREATIYTVEAHDKASGQPIEGADGRIYAGTKDGATTYDGLIPGLKPGTYTAKIRFITAGQWSVGLQFRRDTMKTNDIEQTQTWDQEVLPASGETVH
jgi:YtkA-like